VPISILHGKNETKDKDFEMQRFARRKPKILKATTLLKLVNVPECSL
jgi:RecG-like helicase